MRYNFFVKRELLKIGAIALLFLLGLCAPLIAQTSDRATELQQLIQSKYCDYCHLEEANLSGLNLQGASLRGAYLMGANLSNTNLESADLTNALLNGSNLSGASFRFADLTNATLQGADMNPGADFTGATMNQTVMPNGTISTVVPNPAR